MVSLNGAHSVEGRLPHLTKMGCKIDKSKNKSRNTKVESGWIHKGKKIKSEIKLNIRDNSWVSCRFMHRSLRFVEKFVF